MLEGSVAFTNVHSLVCALHRKFSTEEQTLEDMKNPSRAENKAARRTPNTGLIHRGYDACYKKSSLGLRIVAHQQNTCLTALKALGLSTVPSGGNEEGKQEGGRQAGRRKAGEALACRG